MAWFSSAGRADLRRKSAETVRDFLLAGRLRNCVNQAMVETTERRGGEYAAPRPASAMIVDLIPVPSPDLALTPAGAALTAANVGRSKGNGLRPEASEARLAAGHLGQEIEESACAAS